MNKSVYAAVTADEYEFIIHLEDKAKDLMKILGISENCFYKSLKRGSVTDINGEKIKIIKIDLDDSN